MQAPTLSKYLKLAKNRGFVESIVHQLIQLFLPVFKIYLKLVKKDTFQLNEKIYDYYRERTGATWSSERTVEVPPFLRILKDGLDRGDKILEVGNVLRYYTPDKRAWTVVDKYEVGKNVLNEDIVDFNDGKKYDMVLSISTMEHVGFDEDEKDDKKIEASVKNVIDNLLTNEGVFVLSIPIGYNKRADELIFEKKLKFDDIYFMKRTGLWLWEQAEQKDVKGTSYGNIYYGSASAFAILVINSKGSSKFKL